MTVPNLLQLKGDEGPSKWCLVLETGAALGRKRLWALRYGRVCTRLENCDHWMCEGTYQTESIDAVGCVPLGRTFWGSPSWRPQIVSYTHVQMLECAWFYVYICVHMHVCVRVYIYTHTEVMQSNKIVAYCYNLYKMSPVLYLQLGLIRWLPYWD